MSETREVLERFRYRKLSLPECISALDAALAGLIPGITHEQLPALRAMMFVNNERVMEEMERRGPPLGNSKE